MNPNLTVLAVASNGILVQDEEGMKLVPYSEFLPGEQKLYLETMKEWKKAGKDEEIIRIIGHADVEKYERELYAEIRKPRPQCRLKTRKKNNALFSFFS